MPARCLQPKVCMPLTPWLRALFAAVLLGIVTGAAWAATIPANQAAAFQEAKLLYEQGEYLKAAEAFERLATNGVSTAALHFNLGNAWLKAGRTGQAMLHYRLAERLAPRDRDVQTNLRLARTLVRGDAPPRPTWWRRPFQWLTLNEWTLAATAAFWLCLLLRATGFLKPGWWPRLRTGFRGGIALTVLLGLAACVAWSLHPGREAVVIGGDATLRHGPLEESPAIQLLKPGQELVVVDRQPGWVRVDGAPRGAGWVQERDLALLPR